MPNRALIGSSNFLSLVIYADLQTRLLVMFLTSCFNVDLSLGLIAFLFFITRTGGELSTRDLQKMVQALPQYSDQIDKLSLHVEVGFILSVTNFELFTVACLVLHCIAYKSNMGLNGLIKILFFFPIPILWPSFQMLCFFVLSKKFMILSVSGPENKFI
jgi:hypothetical protein